MSIDKSLVVKDKLKRSRNVLKRDERIERLVDEERWNEGDSVFGLPKVKVVKVKRGKHKEKKKEEEAAGTVESTEKAAETSAE